MADAVKVLIVDDDPLVRSSLAMMLGGHDSIRVVGEAGDGSEVPAAVDGFRPDVVLMDIRMPNVDGLTATRQLQGRETPPAVIVLTTFDTDDMVFTALHHGAAGFLLKDTPPDEIIRAIGLVAAGEAMLSPTVTRQVLDYLSDGRRGESRAAALEAVERLTDREREVAIAIGEGCSNQQIAERLHMSVATVKAHVSRLFDKLDASNRVQVALIARESGLT